MKISYQVENIFSHSVALFQKGNLKSTIYAYGKEIFILNQDKTLFFKFSLSQHNFDQPISFYSNDYDSNHIEIEKDSVCFVKRQKDYERKKYCKVPNLDFHQVQKLFGSFELKKENHSVIENLFLSFLENDLSHIEFSCKNKKLRIIQRDVYSGNVIKITKRSSDNLGLFSEGNLSDFSPIGLRTADFLSLFVFVESFDFYFTKSGYVWVESRSGKMKMIVIISKCKYDELGGE